ncbi:hypothetical protein [Actinomyces sp. 432]|uniref:hypothetical protein n=1 Tax=Actinomyces sp. 432 TaxID=2057798 RepID=UPI001379A63C|nr:hypothetical protein [Actinomyces sp. 432]
MSNGATPTNESPVIPTTLIRRSIVGRNLLESEVRSGQLTQIRRDAYIHLPPDAAAWERQTAMHAVMLETVRTDELSGVVVLESAVLMHGGNTWHAPDALHLAVPFHVHGLRRPPTRRDPTRPPSRDLSPLDRRRALASRALHRHHFQIPDTDVITIDGIRVTGLERTIEDCARYLQPDAALVAVDSLMAIATGALTPPTDTKQPGYRTINRPWDRAAEINREASMLRTRIMDRLSRRRGERGVRRARAVIEAATPWSQSPYETELRRICLANGLTAPTPQMPLHTETTTFFADLGWQSLRRAAEVDGLIKLRHDPDAVRARQAARDDAFIDQGFEIAHFSPDEVRDTDRALERLRALLPRTACESRPVSGLRTKRERTRAAE